MTCMFLFGIKYFFPGWGSGGTPTSHLPYKVDKVDSYVVVGNSYLVVRNFERSL